MQQVELSYELRQTGEDSAASGNSAIVYQLIRREGAAHTQQSSTFSGTSSGRAERVLTSQDLYRLSDDEKESGTVLHQHAIDGLVDAQFWYFDGQAWSSNWQDGSRYPKAVALSYDLPSKRGVVPIPRSDLSGGQLFKGDLANSSSALQSLASEVTLDGQSEDFESLQKDIKLIVRVPGQSYVANSNATQLRLNGKLQGVAQ